MKKKRILLTLMIFTMLFALYGEGSKEGKEMSKVTMDPGPFGKYHETITLTYGKSINPSETLGAGETHENNQYTRHVLKELNIDAKTYWQVASNDSDQKINLAIASNDIPDAMVVNSTQLYQLIRAEQIADLTEVYNNFASDAVKSMMNKAQEQVKAATYFNGKMMAIPSLNVPDDSYHFIWVRQDWLDKLGLNPPKTVTDLENIARAFIEQDPDGNGLDDTIGYAGNQSGSSIHGDFLNPNNNTMGFDAIFAAHKAFPGFWVNDAKGELTYGSLLPETREALERLAKMYAEGLIDKEMGLRKDATETVVAGKCGLFGGVWWMGYHPFPDAWNNNPEANFQAYALQADDGKSYYHMGTPCNLFAVVKKDYLYPEAAIKIIGLNNRDENTFDLDKGGVGNEVLRLPLGAYDEMKVELDALMKWMKDGIGAEGYSKETLSIYKLMENDLKTLPKVKKKPYEDINISSWNRKGDPNFPRLYSVIVGTQPIYNPRAEKVEVYSAIYSQTETMNTRWSNLKKMEDETFMKIIMGVEPIESFDRFVDAWKAQGGDIIIDEVRQAVK